ncbi:hypothetical protein F5Y07DRAFT_362815 [Xylaria sp. FL0933]|nr:hypothetical protein F5Y07DRAFT_362815 [Xylaria sp. FL0933]
MDASERKSRKWLACDLVALTDAELDQYLEDHRLQSGTTLVEVEDPQNLSESFIQRLRDRANRSPSDVVQSRTIDLNRVNARLLEFSASSNSSRSPSPSPSPRPKPVSPSSSTQSPEPLEMQATTFYHKLVLEGGRPLYPITILGDVSKDPAAYCDLLQPWQSFYHHPRAIPEWNIFWEQWASWRCFRRWQAYNRIPGCPLRRDRSSTVYDTFVIEFRRRCTTYGEALEQLLALYNFTRPCKVHQDPKQQDKVTTWIEYLAYVCCVHYEYASHLKRERPVFNEAWKGLVQAKVLEASDTREWICDIKSAIQRQIEADQAWHEFELAEAALLSAQGASDSHRNPSCGDLTPTDSVLAVRARLDTAREVLAFRDRRREHITKFIAAAREYLDVQRAVECNDARIRWIVEQLPLIEAEEKQSRVPETATSTPRGVKRGYVQEDTDKSSGVKRKRRRVIRKLNPPSSRGSGLDRSERTLKSGKTVSKVSKVGGSNGNGKSTIHAVGNPSSYSQSDLFQQKIVPKVSQSSVTAPVLRRSARIRAYQQQSRLS